MKTHKFIICLLILAIIFSCCKKDEDTNNNNDPAGTFGEVGNSWNVKVDGTHDLSAEVISKEGNVYTIEVTYAKLITKTLKFGFSDKEVVDYVYGQGDVSQPFTMVKFDAEVGDMYYQEIGGVYHHREVMEKKTYNIPALGKDLETIGVYEWIPYEIPSQYFGFTVREIIWYWHPDYGLVCVEFYTEEGDYIKVVFVQIDL